MRAAAYDEYEGPITVRDLPDPECPLDGVVLKIHANGVCRSDWHGWMGHDRPCPMPHVPGHEMAGEIVAVGAECLGDWKIGDRVCSSFLIPCGHCPTCMEGSHEICPTQDQPGFTIWGGFAEYVAIPRAHLSLVHLLEGMDFVSAASLGCRFTTSFRAVLGQGRLKPGEWLAVHACGGVGLSAVMIGKGAGARVIAIDADEGALERAKAVGAEFTLNAKTVPDIPEAIEEITGGGVHVSVDALGHKALAYNSVMSLRRRGRHVQVGLVEGDHADPPMPMGRVIGYELELIGSHGMAGYRYPELIGMLSSGAIDPAKLVSRRISLEEGAEMLMNMEHHAEGGIAVIDRF